MERKVYKNLKVTDMARLPEFGFEEDWSNWWGGFFWTVDDVVVRANGEVYVDSCQDCVRDEPLLKLYDMIKAGIVEKV